MSSPSSSLPSRKGFLRSTKSTGGTGAVESWAQRLIYFLTVCVILTQHQANARTEKKRKALEAAIKI